MIIIIISSRLAKDRAFSEWSELWRMCLFQEKLSLLCTLGRYCESFFLGLGETGVPTRVKVKDLWSVAGRGGRQGSSVD